MAQQKRQTDLPQSVIDYIDLVIKKMRYRKSVRADVRCELIDHFTDALKDCETDEEKNTLADELIAEFGDPIVLAKLIRKGKKRCRPLWRTIVARGFQAIGLLFVWVIMYSVYISFAQPIVKVNYVDRYNRLGRPAVDESQNAAPLYDKAIELYVEPPKLDGKDLMSVIEENWPAKLEPQKLKALTEWIDSNAEAVDYFTQASKKPYCWWQRKAEDNMMLSMLLPELGPLRDLTKLICWRAKLRAYNGQPKEGFGDLFACYRLGQRFSGTGTLVEQLVGIAIHRYATRDIYTILENIQIEPELLESLQAQLQVLASANNYTVDFQAEKSALFDVIQRCYTDNGRGSGRMLPREIIGIMDGPFSSSGLFRLGVALISTDRKSITNKVEDLYDKFNVYAQMTPWLVKQSDIDDWQEEFEQASWITQMRYILYYQLTPALRKVCEISYRTKASTEGLITTIALLRYERDKGGYPADLNELVGAGYLDKVPLDPYSDNEPLVYKKTADSFILYSFGKNCVDDGGESGKNRKGDFRQWAEEGDTIFWPVPN